MDRFAARGLEDVGAGVARGVQKGSVHCAAGEAPHFMREGEGGGAAVGGVEGGVGQARRTEGSQAVAEVEAGQGLDAEGAEGFAADFVAGEAGLFDQGDLPAFGGEGVGGRGAGGAGADDGDLEGHDDERR